MNRLRIAAVAALVTGSALAQESLVLVGTYSRGKSKGIYSYKFNSATGKLTELGLAAETVNPSYLVIHPNRRWVFATNEVGEYQKERSGSISAFSLDEKTGKLTLLNVVSSRGQAPCHLSIDKTGKYLLAANYSSGTISIMPIGADGKLGQVRMAMQHRGGSTNPNRQKEPHAHSVNVSANNKYAVAADLGTDELIVYRLDAKRGALDLVREPLKVEGGRGPRHFAFHPGGKFAYAVNELGSSVTALTWDASAGLLKEIQTLSTLPEGFDGSKNTCAEVVVSANGKHVYASNRGHHSIAVFDVDAATGRLTAKGQVKTGGETPRNFNIDPTGQYLLAANQNSDSVTVFKIGADGGLTPTGEKAEPGMPVCVKFLPLK
jgi:6-phosphogluconolactonase